MGETGFPSAGSLLKDVPADDRQFVVDLGLARRDPKGGLVIANPIYKEVLPRVLAGGPQDSLPQINPAWLDAEGRLDVERLLEAFLAFWSLPPIEERTSSEKGVTPGGREVTIIRG